LRLWTTKARRQGSSVKLSAEIAGLTRRANVESVTKHLQTWGGNDRSPVRWQNVEYLCYELAKTTQTLSVGAPDWTGPMREWVYIMPDGISIEMKGLIFNLQPEAWYFEAGIAPWPDARALDFIGHRDHWRLEYGTGCLRRWLSTRATERLMPVWSGWCAGDSRVSRTYSARLMPPSRREDSCVPTLRMSR